MQSGFVFEELETVGGSCALERNVSANSFALSAASMAHEPSGRFNAGMVSVQPAFVNSEVAIFHQPLDPSPKYLSLSRVFPT